MLAATGIKKSYDGINTILNGVDLTLEPGKITCLIGPSGSGKTTFLKCLSMVEYPDAGSIRVDGFDYAFPAEAGKPFIHQPWPHMTAVFQSLFLWPHLTLRENILLPARNVNANASRDIEGLIAFFEMGHFIDRYPNEASGGQRQRVALARALILNPKYVMLDEITSALDVEQTARILTKLVHLKERNIGTLLITHHLNFARRAADHIVFMADGAIVEQGPASILIEPKSQRLQAFLSLAADAA